MRATQPLGKKINVKVIITLLLFSSITINNSFAERSYTVQNSDFLEKIVRKNYPGSTRSNKEQIMVAILRANPAAFRGGNIHFLKKVDSLILPDDAIIALIPKDEAARTIQEHYKLFLQKKTGNFPRIPLPKLTDSQHSKSESSPAENEDENSTKSQERDSNQDGAATNAIPSDSNTAPEAETNDIPASNNNDTTAPEPQLDSNEDSALVAQTKENRISELERKKNEQDLILQQLDEKIETLENNSSTNSNIDSETEESPVDSTIDVKQEEATIQEAVETEPNTALTTAPPEETEKAPHSTTDTDEGSSFLERFLQNKQNLAFLLLPLLGLIGLLFWRRKKQPSIAADDNHEIISESANTNTLNTTTEDHDTPPIKRATTSKSMEGDAAIKIDMARAYQDMGYSDAAKEILEEVLNEGNDEQKEMAQALLAVF